jgi:hypothetical protein
MRTLSKSSVLSAPFCSGTPGHFYGSKLEPCQPGRWWITLAGMTDKNDPMPTSIEPET